MYSLPASYCLRHFIRLIPPRIQWLVPDFKNTTRYLPLFSCFSWSKHTDFSFPTKKDSSKNSTPGGFNRFSFFLIIRLKLLWWSVEEHKVGFWMTFSLPLPSCILNSSTQKSLKLFRRKYDAMYLIRKKGGNNNKKQNKNWNKTVSQISNCHFLLLSFYEGYIKGGPWGGPWTRGHWVFSGHPKFTSEFLFWNEALLSWLP